MAERGTLRTLIWVSLGIQLAGLVFEMFWHALHAGFEAGTTREMVGHLSSVHLPIYFGVLCVLVMTALALIAESRRRDNELALPIAFVGALISAAGEAWHASTHMQLKTYGGPVAAAVSFFGFLVVVGALWLSRGRARGAADKIDQRRAA